MQLAVFSNPTSQCSSSSKTSLFISTYSCSSCTSACSSSAPIEASSTFSCGARGGDLEARASPDEPGGLSSEARGEEPGDRDRSVSGNKRMSEGKKCVSFLSLAIQYEIDIPLNGALATVCRCKPSAMTFGVPEKLEWNDFVSIN